MPPPPLPPIPIESLVGNASAFPVLGHWSYFNHAGVCPLPAVCAEALRAYAAEAAQGAYLNTDWYARIERLRHRLAELIGASAGEVALLKNTSEGIATVAQSIRWNRGDRIVTTASEYPSNLWPWQQAAREHGLELVVVPERARADGRVAIDEAELLEEASQPGVRLVAVSRVQFATGQRLDVERLGSLCRSSGVLLAVDAIQSVGLMPVDVRRLSADFLAADGHKWMLGPEGAGFLYIRREVLPELRTPLVGWNSAKNALAFDASRFDLKEDASRYECGTLTVPAFLALLASVEMLLGVGLEAVEDRVGRLTRELVAGLPSLWRTVTPDPVGIVSLLRDGFDSDALRSVCIRLRKEHRIECAVRGGGGGQGGGRLRVSPHFYNTSDQIHRLCQILADI